MESVYTAFICLPLLFYVQECSEDADSAREICHYSGRFGGRLDEGVLVFVNVLMTTLPPP